MVSLVVWKRDAILDSVKGLVVCTLDKLRKPIEPFCAGGEFINDATISRYYPDVY